MVPENEKVVHRQVGLTGPRRNIRVFEAANAGNKLLGGLLIL